MTVHGDSWQVAMIWTYMLTINEGYFLGIQDDLAIFSHKNYDVTSRRDRTLEGFFNSTLLVITGE